MACVFMLGSSVVRMGSLWQQTGQYDDAPGTADLGFHERLLAVPSPGTRAGVFLRCALPLVCLPVACSRESLASWVL